jgi:ABC-2 type transport system permease protein
VSTDAADDGLWLVVGLGADLTVRCTSEVRAFRFLVPAVVGAVGAPVGIWNYTEWATPFWSVLGLAAGALAFAAMGLAIGAVAREVRAASLLAFMLSLPLAFLALVPSGAVSPALYDVIRFISALFPFKATLQALDAALNGAGGLGTALLHLAALFAGFALLGRVALRRFA